MTRSRLLPLLFLCVFLAPLLEAKDQFTEIVWPPSGPPVVKFGVGKFAQTGSNSSTHTRVYSVDLTVENVWGRKINTSYFYLYVYDKNKARIGELSISITNAEPGEVIKLQRTLQMSGTPVSFEIEPRSLPADLRSFTPSSNVSITVNSVPQGATLRVDGRHAGTTPYTVELALGRHRLELTKEGFGAKIFPLQIRSGDVPVDSVTYDLRPVTNDTVELRDGSLLSGEVESVSATEVVIRVGGNLQHLERSQVRSIQFIEKEKAESAQ